MASVDLKFRSLASPDLLLHARAHAVDAVRRAGIRSYAPPTIRRIDLATDVLFDGVPEAQRALEALSALTVAKHKRIVTTARGSSLIETVSWMTDRSIRLRVYDKTAQSKLPGAGGIVVRFEHQHRPRFRDQDHVERFMERDHSQLAVKPLRVGNDHRLFVADLVGLCAHLAGLREVGALTEAKAERVLGSLVWAHVAGPESWSSRTAQERRREFNSLGVAYHPRLAVPYDLGPLLLAVKAAWQRPLRL